MASVTVTVTQVPFVSDTTVEYNISAGSYFDLGTSLSTDGSINLYLGQLEFVRTASHVFGRLEVRLAPDQTTSVSPFGPEFSDAMESSGTITYVASDGETLTVTGISDSTEPYVWIPTEPKRTEVASFADHLAGLSDQSLTVTFNDNSATEPAQPDAPSLTVASSSSITVAFTDPDDGGSAITSRNVRYRETGTNAWTTLSDETFPYTITGLNSATEYDVQIQAVNAEGSSEWSDAATATTSAEPPVFADPTGDVQTWVIGVEITPIIIPSATGSEPITYEVVGSLPDGITYEPSTITQTFDLETSLFLDSNQVVWGPAQADEDIDDRYVLNSGTELSLFYVYSDGGVQVNLSSSTGLDDQFTDAAESAEGLITLRVQGLEDVIINGPTHPSGSQDPTEPYNWIPNNAADIASFFTSITTSTSVTMILSIELS